MLVANIGIVFDHTIRLWPSNGRQAVLNAKCSKSLKLMFARGTARSGPKQTIGELLSVVGSGHNSVHKTISLLTSKISGAAVPAYSH